MIHQTSRQCWMKLLELAILGGKAEQENCSDCSPFVANKLITKKDSFNHPGVCKI